MELGELRIGNWVKIEGLPEQQITLRVFFEVSDIVSRMSGIQLNEEWLTQLGFKNEGIGWRMDIFKGKYSFREISISWCNDRALGEWYFFFRDGTPKTPGDDHIVTITRELRYVHELQNLYYAITKKELTLRT